MSKPINIIFDGAPVHNAGHFVEVETDDGRSINAGQWIKRDDGTWALRITELPANDKPVCNKETHGVKFLAGYYICPECGEHTRTK